MKRQYINLGGKSKFFRSTTSNYVRFLYKGLNKRGRAMIEYVTREFDIAKKIAKETTFTGTLDYKQYLKLAKRIKKGITLEREGKVSVGERGSGGSEIAQVLNLKQGAISGAKHPKVKAKGIKGGIYVTREKVETREATTKEIAKAKIEDYKSQGLDTNEEIIKELVNLNTGEEDMSKKDTNKKKDTTSEQLELIQETLTQSQKEKEAEKKQAAKQAKVEKKQKEKKAILGGVSAVFGSFMEAFRRN